jgi:hypothetical protein
VPPEPPDPTDKTCESCGRRIEWRRKWERDWAQVRYCSAACRRHGVTDTDRRLEQAVLDLLDARAPVGRLGPGDVGGAAAGEAASDANRPALLQVGGQSGQFGQPRLAGGTERRDPRAGERLQPSSIHPVILPTDQWAASSQLRP